jgi:hypothetical protein
MAMTAMAMLIMAVGCTRTPGPKKEEQASPAPEILVTVPKWTQVGVLAPETPTVRNILEKYAGQRGGADEIITANEWKYNQAFYRSLVFGSRVFVSEDDELLIVPPGGGMPQDMVTKRVPNPDFFKGLVPAQQPRQEQPIKEKTLRE